jgi:hypothetical protein
MTFSQVVLLKARLGLRSYFYSIISSKISHLRAGQKLTPPQEQDSQVQLLPQLQLVPHGP